MEAGRERPGLHQDESQGPHYATSATDSLSWVGSSA
jgi:hypothetical protein